MSADSLRCHQISGSTRSLTVTGRSQKLQHTRSTKSGRCPRTATPLHSWSYPWRYSVRTATAPAMAACAHIRQWPCGAHPETNKEHAIRNSRSNQTSAMGNNENSVGRHSSAPISKENLSSVGLHPWSCAGMRKRYYAACRYLQTSTVAHHSETSRSIVGFCRHRISRDRSETSRSTRKYVAKSMSSEETWKVIRNSKRY